MTLSTNIYILAPFDAEDLHNWVNKNLLKLTVKPETTVSPKRRGNVLGQGFDAIVTIQHNEGKLFSRISDLDDEFAGMIEFYEKHSEFVTENETPETLALKSVQDTLKYEAKSPLSFGMLNFDTAYGYQGDDGMGCGDLHALWIVRLVNEYFGPKNIRIRWQNEFTGKYYNNAKGVETLGSGGKDAKAWMEGTVLPAIAADLLSR